MRWESLFADLEAQWEAEASAGLEGEIAEAERLERSGMCFEDRLRAHRGQELTLRLAGGARVQLRLDAVGRDWLAGVEGHAAVIVPHSAVVSAEPLGRGSEQEPSQVRRRLGLGAPLRALLRDRAVVVVQGAEGEVLAEGLLAAVGRDHLEVALRVPGDVPRRGSLRGVRTVPFSAVAMVRSAGGGAAG